jgi:serine/threonine-protein kinase
MMLSPMKAVSALRVSGAAIVLLLFGSRAGAQTASDKAAAEALFDQGRSAMQEGDFGKACGLLERSQHIDPGVGTLLYLAECYEKSNRTASAWATFREAADAADRAKESARARTGRDRAARLEPFLSRLTIQVAPDAQQIPGLSIERGAMPIQQALWNVPVPVDPGEYSVRAMAPGYESWSQTVTVPEKAAKAAILVPPLKKSAEPDKGVAAAPPADPTKPNAPPSPDGQTLALQSQEPDRAANSQRTLAYVLGGAGILGVGIGSFFGLRAISKNSDAKSHCHLGYYCDDADGPALADDARSAARLSTISFAIGAAALAGGAILFFTSPSSGQRSPTAHLAVGPTGVVVGGSFQ